MQCYLFTQSDEKIKIACSDKLGLVGGSVREKKIW